MHVCLQMLYLLNEIWDDVICTSQKNGLKMDSYTLFSNTSPFYIKKMENKYNI